MTMGEVRPYGRSVAVFAGLLLVVVFLTYRSFDHTVFYANWVAGLAAVGMASILALFRGSLSVTGIFTLLVSSAWVIVAVFVTPFATDIQHHLKILIVSSFYLLASVIFVDTLLRSKIDIGRVFYNLMVVWFLVNITLLVLYFIELYIPAKRTFSGVFHDRNVFSITTLIVLSLALPFLDSFGKKRRVLLVFMALSCAAMILISKSVTGLVGLVVLLFFYSLGLKLVNKIVMLFLAFFILLAVLLTANPVKDRVDRFVLSATGQTEQLHTNESAYIRMHLLKNGLQLGLDHSITGVGLDNARLHVMWPERKTGSFLHNTYLDILTSGGFLMFIFYYLPIFFVLLWLILKRKDISRLSSRQQGLYKAATFMLFLKVTYDFTWTTYFEFAMVFSVVFSIYIYFILKRELAFDESSLYRQYPSTIRPYKPTF